jgi:hypothetical protein
MVMNMEEGEVAHAKYFSVHMPVEMGLLAS